MTTPVENYKPNGEDAAGPPPRSRARTGGYWLFLLAKGATTVLLLYLATRNVRFDQVQEKLSQAEGVPLLAAFALLTLAQCVGAVRLASVMGALRLRLGFMASIRLQFVGLFFNSALPSSVGGDAVRIWLLTRGGFPFERALGGILIDRSSAVVALVMIVAAAQPILDEIISSDGLRQTMLVVVIGIFFAIPVALSLDRLPAGLRRIPIIRPLFGIVRDARIVYLSWGHGSKIIGMSIAIQFAASISYFLLAWTLNVTMPLSICIVLVPAVILATTLPISIGGWGVREAATVTLFGAAGVDPEGALLVSISYGVTMFTIGLPGGVIWFIERSNKLTHKRHENSFF